MAENGACSLATDRATNIPARASRSFGRFCPVLLWPDLKCPPRKSKGVATVRLPNGALREVELHWYEAHGIGRRDMKIKRYLDES